MKSLLRRSIRFATTLATGFLLTQTGCLSKEEPTATVSAANGIDGKVFAGYQGWYRTPDDGSGLGYEHYETYQEKFEPGHSGIDYWPDLSEFDEEEKFKTPFKHADGSPAHVFSSTHPKTVDRHFLWMKQHGIDGIFLQRFVHDVVGGHHQRDLLYPSNNKVLANCKDGARNHQRAYALMYDLSGCSPEEVARTWTDWTTMDQQYGLAQDPNYLQHEGKPVIAIWGVGFSDGRAYDLQDVKDLVTQFRSAPGPGFTIVLGVPTYWRELKNDATSNPEFHELIKEADVVLPWTVGRVRTPADAERYGETLFKPDLEWCRENDTDYLPVICPGFSWANRKNLPDKFNDVPRLGGEFLWSQAIAARKAGASMIYVAMFDEMDEGTQIFKTSAKPPVGETRFLSYEPEPSDFYLRLTGEIGKMIRGEIPATADLPKLR